MDACLSPRFATDEGMDRCAYLDHELQLFTEVGPLYDLGNGFSLNTALAPISTPERVVVETQIVNRSNCLVYEWAYHLDEVGRILGNGSGAQTVSKIQVANGTRWIRALAVTSPRPIAVIAPTQPTTALSFQQTRDDGVFWNLCFVFQDDLPLTKWETFRIRYLDGTVERKHVWLRGFDRPLFHPSSVTLSGCEVHMTSALPWSLASRCVNGGQNYIRFPRMVVARHAEPVVWACLTDAFDHDWISSLEPLELFAEESSCPLP